MVEGIDGDWQFLQRHASMSNPKQIPVLLSHEGHGIHSHGPALTTTLNHSLNFIVGPVLVAGGHVRQISNLVPFPGFRKQHRPKETQEIA